MPRREAFEGARFTEEKRKIHADPRRWDDLQEAITWALLHDAEQFPQASGTRLRRIRAKAAYGLPALTIYYTIDSDALCTLQWVEETIPGPEPPDDIPF